MCVYNSAKAPLQGKYKEIFISLYLPYRPVRDGNRLEHFPAKWMPVCPRKCDKINESRA
jgi:hypothetical protein